MHSDQQGDLRDERERLLDGPLAATGTPHTRSATRSSPRGAGAGWSASLATGQDVPYEPEFERPEPAAARRTAGDRPAGRADGRRAGVDPARRLRRPDHRPPRRWPRAVPGAGQGVRRAGLPLRRGVHRHQRDRQRVGGTPTVRRLRGRALPAEPAGVHLHRIAAAAPDQPLGRRGPRRHLPGRRQPRAAETARAGRGPRDRVPDLRRRVAPRADAAGAVPAREQARDARPS